MKPSREKANTPPRHVVLGIGGGVSAYKAVETASRLTQIGGLAVDVLMTRAARRFVAPLSFEAVTRRRVWTALFPDSPPKKPEDIFPHLYPASQADLFAVLPATADLIAKLAAGTAGDLVSAASLALKRNCPRVLCPAMNTAMWNSASVQRNLRVLEDEGWLRVGPGEGALACGTAGAGRMAEPDEIVARLLSLLILGRQLAGRRVLILSGPTHEYLDPVRFIGNASQGFMGQALAHEALDRGAQVDFVTGPVPRANLPRGHGLTLHGVTSAREMMETARKLFAGADIAVFAAAVADYAPRALQPHKLRRAGETIALELEPTPDIAATLGKLKKTGQITAGFALETHDGLESARRKLASKNLDAVLLNGAESIGADLASFTLLSGSGKTVQVQDWGRIRKAECARRLFDALTAMPGRARK